jgi:PadR family transcriptional regulator PadR
MRERKPRLSFQTLRVLRLFMNQPVSKLAGSDIWKEIGIQSGTLYPILARLEKAGWLGSEWESIDPKEAARPRKRLYWITGLGQTEAHSAFAELDMSEGQRAWNMS